MTLQEQEMNEARELWLVWRKMAENTKKAGLTELSRRQYKIAMNFFREYRAAKEQLERVDYV